MRPCVFPANAGKHKVESRRFSRGEKKASLMNLRPAGEIRQDFFEGVRPLGVSRACPDE